MTTLASNFNDIPLPTARRLAAGLLKTTDSHIYQVPTGMAATIHSMWIASTHTGSVSVRISHARPSESLSTSNALLYDVTISSKTTTVYDQPMYLTAGDRIMVRADTADKICITIYGVES
jgi:hypothetical protein